MYFHPTLFVSFLKELTDDRSSVPIYKTSFAQSGSSSVVRIKLNPQCPGFSVINWPNVILPYKCLASQQNKIPNPNIMFLASEYQLIKSLASLVVLFQVFQNKDKIR